MLNRILSLLAIVLLPLVASAANSPTPTGQTAAQLWPYSMIGQLTFDSGGTAYVGSGTVLQARGVLTAGHNVYDKVGGWSTDLLFKRGHYGQSTLTQRYAFKVYALSGYRAEANANADSLAAFSRDSGGLKFTKNVAAGYHMNWSTDPSLLAGNTNAIALGYGAERHSGELLLAVKAATPFVRSYKQFFESQDTAIEGGMSGGPVIITLPSGVPAVAGVVVAGTDFPVSGGIRVINAGTSIFIQNYLSN